MTDRLKVGEWTVVPALNCLERGGQSVRVERKVMQVLMTLAEKPGKVHSKEHIFRCVWPDAFVSDEVLTRCISELRKVFEDNPKDPTYIQTIPKGGYRLLATVIAENENEVHSRYRTHRLAAGCTVGVLLLAAFAFYFIGYRKSAAAQIGSLAVLPFTNLSGDATQDYLSDGLTDELITRLTKISALRVVSRTSVMQYKNTRKTAPEIAQELHVDAVVEGSVLRSTGRVRISAQLILARSDRHVWAESYDRDFRDILGLQADVARTVAQEINVQVTHQEQEKLAAAGTVNSEAYDLYLKGRYHWGKFTNADNQKAISYYKQAIEADPNYALAYAGLADVYHELTDAPPGEVIPKSRAASERALQLDEQLAEAHSSLGWVKWIYYWDWAGAETEFQRALQINPNYADAHGMFAEYLDSMGRFAEAAKEREAALRLSPVETILYQNSGEHFLYTRQFDQAIEQYRQALELDSNFSIAHGGLAHAYALKGSWNDSLRHMAIFAELEGAPELAAKIKSLNHELAYRVALQAFLDEIRFQRSKGRWVPATEDAYYYALLGSKNQALSALERAVDERDPEVTELQVSPAYDSIRSDPRFQQLVRRVGLPQRD